MTSAAPLPCRVRNVLDLLIFEIPQNIDTQIKWGGGEGGEDFSQFRDLPTIFLPKKIWSTDDKSLF